MSSAAVSIESIDFAELRALLDRLSESDLRPALDAAGQVLEDGARERISDLRRSPEGKPWEPWSRRYARTRGPGKSLLQDEGRLLDSMTHNVLGDDAVEAGTNLVYAATHQYGDPARNIPARPYLGISRDNLDDILDIFARHFAEALDA